MEKPNIEIVEASDDINSVGTSLAGAIDVSYSKLVKALGEPNNTQNSDSYKIDAAWILKLNGKLITVYNYKDGKNYNGAQGLATSRIRDWHIGYAGREDDIAMDIEQLQKYINSKK